MQENVVDPSIGHVYFADDAVKTFEADSTRRQAEGEIQDKQR